MAYTFKHGDRPLDDFTIQRAVGRGGFGEVYYAISDGGREVALKYLKENPQIELRGVSHCINLKSPHLVSIFDVKKNAEGEYFIVMEYISGPSLRDLLIAEPKGFAPEKAAFFTREIGKGLAYLHDRGIVHRDLKPGNIFFDDGYVKIGDYGLSKFIAISRHSAQTSSVGTVHYMAPEIGSGNYSRGVDIYALGVMLYEMLSGKLPFEGSTMAEVLMKHLTSQPELDNLPRPFGDVIRKALQKDPRDRYATVGEMLDEMLAGEEIQQSLAGFSAKSLEGAVRMGGRDRADSPMPSPNPTPRGFTPGRMPPPRPRVEQMGPLQDFAIPERIARKMDRISDKIDKRMMKLGRRLGRFGMGPPPVGPDGAPDFRDDSPLAHVSPRKRVALIVFLLAAMSVGVGLATGGTMSHVVARFNDGGSGNTLHANEMGAAAGMLVAALFGSVVLAQSMIRWFTVDVGPRWAQRVVRACCALPILAAGAAPTLDAGYGFPIWLGLVGLATFADWDSDKARGYGKLSGGQVFGKALGAFILTAIALSLVSDKSFQRLYGKFMLMSAGIAAAASFVYQAKGAWAVGACRVPRRGQCYPRTAAQGAPRGMDETLPVGSPQGGPQQNPYSPYGQQGQQGGAYGPQGAPYGGPGVPQPATGSWHSQGSRRPATGVPRWLISRMFWSLAAFVLMGGSIVAFIYTLVASNAPDHNITTSVILCTSFAAFMLFAFRKTTPLKRSGFWRESFRPFLVSLSLFGIGLTTTLIAREWDHIDRSKLSEDGSDVDEEDDESGVITITDAQARVEKIRDRLPGHWGLVLPPILKANFPPAQHGPRRCMDEDDKVAAVSGLVLSSIMLLGLSVTALTGRRIKPVQPFLSPANASPLPNAIPTPGTAEQGV